jgi:hypothetical protein
MRAGRVADEGLWLSYTDAAKRLGISREALRRRADRGRWARTRSNTDRTVRIQIPENLVLDASITPVPDASVTRAAPVPDASITRAAPVQDVARALEGHVATLQAEVERLAAELGRRDGELAAARAAADAATAELVALAKRFAAIAESQTAVSEPPRRSVAGRAWRWLLRN